MSLPNFPDNPVLGQNFTVGAVTYKCTSISPRAVWTVTAGNSATTETKSLYDYGGPFEGDCRAAMDLALADNNCKVLIVPDNVTLGRHVFDTPYKVIRGGKNVTFVGDACGLYPRVCEYVEIRDFVEAVLPVFPMSGGVANNGGIFVSTPSGHNIGVLKVLHNSTINGRIGIAVGPEGGSGQIRNIVEIRNNTFKKLNGVGAGSGYGIQYANELLTGHCVIENNTIIESSRNGIYIARNAGQAPIYLYNNHVIDHRKNADNKGAGAYPAFNIARSSNVHGYANQTTRPWDGSLLIGPEEEPPLALNAKNISWRDFTIDTPQNNSPQIFIQYIDVPVGPRTDSVILDGINFTAVGINAPLIDYAYGKRIFISNVYAKYVDILSGSLSVVFLKGGNIANSGDVAIRQMRVVAENCVGADFSVFSLAGAYLTVNLPLLVDDVSYTVDSTFEKMWNPGTAISNTEIVAYNCSDTGIVWAANKQFKRSISPSIQTVSREFNLGAASPNGVIVPKYRGEVILLTDTNSSWMATGYANNTWIMLGRTGNGSNTHGPTGIGHHVAQGYAVSATEARFPLYGDSQTAAISITVTSTFDVITAAGVIATGGSGKTPTLSTTTSNKVTWVAVTGMSGLTVGATYLLRTETGTSAIRVNY